MDIRWPGMMWMRKDMRWVGVHAEEHMWRNRWMPCLTISALLSVHVQLWASYSRVWHGFHSCGQISCSLMCIAVRQVASLFWLSDKRVWPLRWPGIVVHCAGWKDYACNSAIVLCRLVALSELYRLWDRKDWAGLCAVKLFVLNSCLVKSLCRLSCCLDYSLSGCLICL